MVWIPEGWTPDQIASYQKYWDAYFSGESGRRRRAKFVPGAAAQSFVQTKEPELKSAFDDWLARLVCFAFSVSPQALVSQMNRATAEVQKTLAEEEGLAHAHPLYVDCSNGDLAARHEILRGITGSCQVDPSARPARSTSFGREWSMSGNP